VNGASYPPPAPPVVIPADLVVSTLTAANNISTPALFVSSVNGAAYPPNTTVSPDLTVSTLTVSETGSITIGAAATITYGPSATLDLNATAGVNISTVLNVLDIQLSTINGAAYPPSASVSPDLVVSTLTAAINVSTPELFVSSVNGAAYPPSASVPADLIVSTLTAAVEVSTLALKVSTINNYKPNRPIVSSIDVGPRDPTAGIDFEAGIHTYAPIYLQDPGNDTIASGVLTLIRREKEAVTLYQTIKSVPLLHR
jgi:hypothetical protein